MAIQVTRSPHNPIIHPGSNDRIGGNINGPSLIRVPDWVDSPLGCYYLYFGHHQGKFIRMAYADELLGPYKVYEPGVLDIESTSFTRHIASPDVHVDMETGLFTMFYHGSGFTGEKPEQLGQNTCLAVSTDGLSFVSEHVCLGPAYMRVVRYEGAYYGFGGGGGRGLWRASNYRELFESGPKLEIKGEDYTTPADLTPEQQQNPGKWTYRMRHPALQLRGHELDIYYSNVRDHPERIKRTTVDLRPDWSEWRGSQFVEILRTETDYEGIDEPNIPSSGGADHEPVHEVRDPYLFVADGRRYLVYSVAGEHGLGIAEIRED